MRTPDLHSPGGSREYKGMQLNKRSTEMGSVQADISQEHDLMNVDSSK